MFFSIVLRFWLLFASHGWQIALERLHHGCDLNVRICTKHSVFSGRRRVRCGEKLARVRDGCGRRRFAVESVSNCARSGTEGSRWLFLFFVDAVLCYGTLHVLRHFVHWNWCIKTMCSTVVCCKSSLFCNSVSADRSGMAASRFLAAAAACVILVFFAAESRKLIVMSAWKLRMVLWQFLHFGEDDFAIKIIFTKCFEIVFFSVWVSRSGFGACSV